MQPLSGLVVLDFTTLLPGPLATLMLAEAGAEVIKIERPGGEDGRAGQPRFDGMAAGFALLNRGKKGLVLDLKEAADREKLKPLLARADVLVDLRVERRGRSRHGTRIGLDAGRDSLARGIQIPHQGDAAGPAPMRMGGRL